MSHFDESYYITRADYETRDNLQRPPPNGICFECYSTIGAKLGESGRIEYFCPVCAGSRHFCSNRRCFFLVETFYLECGCADHHRFLKKQ